MNENGQVVQQQDEKQTVGTYMGRWMEERDWGRWVGRKMRVKKVGDWMVK